MRVFARANALGRWLDRVESTGHLVPFATLLLLPVVLFAVNDSWTYPPQNGSIDAHIYTGYFHNLETYLTTFGQLYYSARLPWLLLGNAAYSAFSDDTANLVLRLVLFYGGGFSMYAIVYGVWRDRLVALTTALLMVTHTAFLESIATDYVDGPAFVCLLLALACMTMALRSRAWPLWLFGGGAAIIMAISIHIFLLALAPLAVLWFYALDRGGKRHNVFLSFGYMAAGAAVAFLVFALIYNHLTGHWNYLEPQYTAAADIDDTPWQQSIGTWVGRAGWLAFPIVGGLLALALMAFSGWRWRRKSGPVYWPAAAAALMLWAALAVFFALQISTYMTVFQYYMYVSLLTPFIFIVIGAALAVVKAESRGDLPALAVVAPLLIAVLLAPFVFGVLRPLEYCGTDDCFTSAPTVLFMLLAAATLIGALVLRDVRAGIAGVVLLAVLNVGTGFMPVPALDRDARRFELTQEADRAVRVHDSGEQLRFWYDSKEPMSAAFRIISSRHLYGYRLINEQFPSTKNWATSNELPSGIQIAYLTGLPDADLRVAAALSPSNLLMTKIETRSFQRGPDRLDLLIFETRPGGISLPLALNRFQPALGRIEPVGQGIVIETLPDMWAYAAVLPLAEGGVGNLDAPAQLSLRLRVMRGVVGIGAENADSTDFIDRKSVPAADKDVDVFLSVPRLGDARRLVVQSWNAGASSVKIDRVEIYQQEVRIAASDRP